MVVVRGLTASRSGSPSCVGGPVIRVLVPGLLVPGLLVPGLLMTAATATMAPMPGAVTSGVAEVHDQHAADEQDPQPVVAQELQHRGPP